MKKIISFMLAIAMIFALSACGKSDKPAESVPEAPAQTEAPAEDGAVQEPDGSLSMGNTLKNEFLNQLSAGTTDLQQIADAMLANPVIEFAGATMPVEEGYLAGFAEEIHGFESGVMFAPAIGSIAFVGYVFETESEDEAKELAETLTETADPRWNICVTAEETVVYQQGSMVFFVMCPGDAQA